MNKPWFKTEIKKNVNLAGFVVGNYASGEQARVLSKGLITSFEARFYGYVENLSKIFNFNIDKINNILIVIDSNDTAKIYRESFPLSMDIKAKSNLSKFQLVTSNDIIDIISITFSDSQFNVDPLNNEQVIWLFRKGLSFGLYFDLSKKLQQDTFKFETALLFKRVAFFDIYNKIEDELLNNIIKNGWFPFIQIVGNKHEEFFSYFNTFRTDLIDGWCEKTFSNERIEQITSKWLTNYAFIERSKPIAEGISCFIEEKYAAAISSLIPMLEGISNIFVMRTTGKSIGYKGDEITKQVEIISNRKYNEESLFFVKHFKQYLKEYYFKNTTTAESHEAIRNTISHGRATDNSFSRTNAVKIILTLDQLYYFI